MEFASKRKKLRELEETFESVHKVGNSEDGQHCLRPPKLLKCSLCQQKVLGQYYLRCSIQGCTTVHCMKCLNKCGRFKRSLKNSIMQNKDSWVCGCCTIVSQEKPDCTLKQPLPTIKDNCILPSFEQFILAIKSISCNAIPK